MPDYRASIPGWLEAVESEAKQHDDAFAYPHDSLAGIPVRHLSLLDLARLARMESAFVVGAWPSQWAFENFPWLHEDAARLIAYQHTEYDPKRRVRNRRVMRKVRKAEKAKLYRELCEYFECTFADRLPGSSRHQRQIEVAHWSYIADYVDKFASRYGWTDEKIMSMPYRRLIQYARKIAKEDDPKLPMPSKADGVLARHLEERNRKAAT